MTGPAAAAAGRDKTTLPSEAYAGAAHDRFGPSASPFADTQSLHRAIGNHAFNAIQSSSDLPSSVDSVLRREGQPLEPSVRVFMEERFGHDFGHVRVHTDPRAAESAGDVAAKAYTVGNHMVFKSGEYAPDTTEGRHSIAHELAHVVQQSRNVGSPPGFDPDHSLEHAAHDAADRAASGTGGSSVHVSGSSAPGLARQEDDDWWKATKGFVAEAVTDMVSSVPQVQVYQYFERAITEAPEVYEKYKQYEKYGGRALGVGMALLNAHPMAPLGKKMAEEYDKYGGGATGALMAFNQLNPVYLAGDEAMSAMEAADRGKAAEAGEHGFRALKNTAAAVAMIYGGVKSMKGPPKTGSPPKGSGGRVSPVRGQATTPVRIGQTVIERPPVPSVPRSPVPKPVPAPVAPETPVAPPPPVATPATPKPAPRAPGSLGAKVRNRVAGAMMRVGVGYRDAVPPPMIGTPVVPKPIPGLVSSGPKAPSSVAPGSGPKTLRVPGVQPPPAAPPAPAVEPVPPTLPGGAVPPPKPAPPTPPAPVPGRPAHLPEPIPIGPETPRLPGVQPPPAAPTRQPNKPADVRNIADAPRRDKGVEWQRVDQDVPMAPPANDVLRLAANSRLPGAFAPSPIFNSAGGRKPPISTPVVDKPTFRKTGAADPKVRTSTPSAGASGASQAKQPPKLTNLKVDRSEGAGRFKITCDQGYIRVRFNKDTGSFYVSQIHSFAKTTPGIGTELYRVALNEVGLSNVKTIWSHITGKDFIEILDTRGKAKSIRNKFQFTKHRWDQVNRVLRSTR